MPPTGHGPDPELDPYRFPIRPRPEPVRCPRCPEEFTARDHLAAHLVAVHDLSPDPHRRPHGNPPRRGRDHVAPTLRRTRRSPLRRRLASVPLVVVVALNVALALGFWGALDAAAPLWWVELQEESWARFLVIPALSPTSLFLFLRGLD